ncbi:hypothetical protein [Clostridium neonatale]|uniref:hypothetical protein n=1 Tax=Clostridium neonatale TaxID=137838 RepID=UPI00291B6495|nr:hypothetical protein [Clostridium neonatale]CAI3193149.1 Zn-finger containing protein [Clostridium neonatale]CAI3196912.1 Zn-finger containing protein [Clostridium neonatale]
MQNIYRTYKCGSCKKEIILLTEDVERAIKNNKYLTCAYCNCRHLKKIKEIDSIKECFENSEKKR